MTTYFFDTYALIELLRGNPRYAPYADASVVITQLNLLELALAELREFDEQQAREMYRKFKENVHEPSEDTVMAAIQFKLAHPKARYSLADALGYAYANEAKIPFLTGDRQFEGLPNVVFTR